MARLDRKGSWVGGLEKFVGIKQKRRRLLGDECQFMHAQYLTVLSNLDKGDFRGVFVGNALANMKALDRILRAPLRAGAIILTPRRPKFFQTATAELRLRWLGPTPPITISLPIFRTSILT